MNGSIVIKKYKTLMNSLDWLEKIIMLGNYILL